MRPAFGDIRPMFGHPGSVRPAGPPTLRPVIGSQMGMDGTELPSCQHVVARVLHPDMSVRESGRCARCGAPC